MPPGARVASEQLVPVSPGEYLVDLSTTPSFREMEPPVKPGWFIAGHAHEVEAAYREIWQRWLANAEIS